MYNLFRPFIFSLATFLIATPLVADTLDLPDLGDSGAAHMTPAQEKRTGEAVIHNLRRDGIIVDDPLLTDYLNQLGYKLVSQYPGENQTHFTFFLFNQRDINAYAFPGGFIGINYGLLMASDSESELASVLAHEIAHVTQRHHARRYEMNDSSSLPVLAAFLAALVLGNDSSLGQAALTTAITTNAAMIQKSINFTRHNEEEADRIGIQLLARSGFDATKMADFFDKLEKESRLYGSNIPEFLRTHPVNAARITDARNRASSLPAGKPGDSSKYQIMKNRVVALASRDNRETEKQFSEQLGKDPDNPGIRYGYVLSLIKNNKYEQAKIHIDRLLKQKPDRIAYLLAAAEIAHKSGQHKRAYRIYENALKIYPDNTAIMYDYTELLLQDKKYKRANQILESFIKTSPENPGFYRFLANTRKNIGNNAGSHEAMAEYYYQIGQIHQAIDQINLALKESKIDFYTSSRLEARLSFIKEEALPVQQ